MDIGNDGASRFQCLNTGRQRRLMEFDLVCQRKVAGGVDNPVDNGQSLLRII
jgi:hypothetical protein